MLYTICHDNNYKEKIHILLRSDLIGLELSNFLLMTSALQHHVGGGKFGTSYSMGNARTMKVATSYLSYIQKMPLLWSEKGDTNYPPRLSYLKKYLFFLI